MTVLLFACAHVKIIVPGCSLGSFTSRPYLLDLLSDLSQALVHGLKEGRHISMRTKQVRSEVTCDTTSTVQTECDSHVHRLLPTVA